MDLQISNKTYLRPYEAVVLVHPDATEEEQKTLFRKNKAIIESFKGQVNHLDTWGKRPLGNPLSSYKKAIYFHTTFEAEPMAVAELERTMRINDRVLRFVHTRLKDGTSLPKFVEGFKSALAETAAREREREAKFQARKSAARGFRRDDGGDRGDRPERGGFDRGGDRGDRPERGGFDRGGEMMGDGEE